MGTKLSTHSVSEHVARIEAALNRTRAIFHAVKVSTRS